MLLGILIPAVIIIGLLIGGFTFYRRKIAAMAPGESPMPSSARLTAERLRTLPVPPWRVVYEIGDDKLADVDHVVIGPPGVVAITTVLADRPPLAPFDDSPTTVAYAAIKRADVAELVARAAGSCDIIATVYWGAPNADTPAGHQTTVGAFSVEGQRLNDWLMSLPPAAVAPAQLDLWWQAVVTGIDRPDPLTERHS